MFAILLSHVTSFIICSIQVLFVSHYTSVTTVIIDMTKNIIMIDTLKITAIIGIPLSSGGQLCEVISLVTIVTKHWGI